MPVSIIQGTHSNDIKQIVLIGQLVVFILVNSMKIGNGTHFLVLETAYKK